MILLKKTPNPARIAGLIAAALLLQGGVASAMSLTQAYDAALRNDPNFKMAEAERAAGAESRILGRSALLPQVQANYSRNKNRADLTQEQFGKPITTHPEYLSGTTSVQLRQPLFSLDAYARYKQGVAQAQSSEAGFDVRRQELVLRVVGAYTDALFASEQVRLATAQRDTLAEQAKVNDRMFVKGEGTRTDQLETQARLDVAEAALIEAQDNLTTALATLSEIVGEEVKQLDGLAPVFPIAPMPAGGFEAWKALALRNNPEVIARTYNVEAARQEVNKQRAGHFPRVDFVASYAKADAETLNTYQQESTSRAIGVQVTIPIYSGGAVSASTRQASANQIRAKAELEAQTDRILVDLRKQYSAAISSVQRIQALEKAVESGRLLMKATEQSIKGGVRINLDLLNAQQQLYVSQRDLAQARYNYLLSLLRLRAAAGTLSQDDVTTTARYFR
jgi:protease secretion system outer membrane protein